MSENFKFVQNRKCEYFPCHRTEKKDEFNCLFCFCPLYMLKDKCGGHFKYTKNVKDCSDCTFVHTLKAHQYVMSKMKKVIAIGSERESSG